MSYSAIPLYEEWIKYTPPFGGEKYLAQFGEGRYPYRPEIEAVLASFEGFFVEYEWRCWASWTNWGKQELWDAWIGSATLDSSHWMGAHLMGTITATGLVKFQFYRANLELAIVILERLSHQCGPFVLMNHSGSKPIVATPGMNIEAAIKLAE